MQFNNLKEKCEYYRSLGEHRLMPNGHIIMMLDGRSFSKLIKNKFEKPFDGKFVEMMNGTAQYLCEKIPGVKFAYVQSDEISLYIQDNYSSGSFFDLRQTKLLSVSAAMAAGKFNQLMMDYRIACVESNSGCAGDIIDDCRQAVLTSPLYEFDCKVWTVPNENDVYAWFLYRQLDCIRNSKQQSAQTWLPHSRLSGLDTDKQIALLKEEKGIDWHDFGANVKFGRIVRKLEREVPIPKQFVKDGVLSTMRGFWETSPMPVLNEESGKDEMFCLINGEF